MTRLRIEGEVGAPRELGFDELAALPHQIEDIGSLIPARRGGGVRLHAVLDTVGIDARATHVTFTATDGTFAASVPLEAVHDAVIVYRLGNQPLAEDQGGPMGRCAFTFPTCKSAAIGGADACANVKHLGSIRLTRGAAADTRPRCKL